MSSQNAKDNPTPDLNSLPIFIRRDSRQVDRPKTIESGCITAVFDNIEGELVNQIEKASAVFGCVAWLTNERILRALATRTVSVVVQKEDFLRPDQFAPQVSAGSFYKRLRELYSQLQCGITPWDMQGVPSAVCRELGYCMSMEWTGTDYEPVRCLGARRRGKAQAEALMHHKFLVFCELKTGNDDFGQSLENVPHPYSVWTGSFNLTHNATRSLENAVLIRDAKIARAYLDEYLYLYQFSEPLDWSSEWVERPYLALGPKS
ncbi:MAG TPA: phospholipase D-like domain-containing protein [Tepidisphaeraceae bacterium]|jgi:phosphatidylserine/phosphatidylglycerophosphate/cardiolipin synthase-like enzyme|nr:phospholipase D-like domain-containing protein [Tepidisphaeraceae bacterium]